MKQKRTVKVEFLARVEGEGALDVKLDGGQVSEVKLRIFEPPRLFEAFLRGRRFEEAPDITARICGICPIAYQMSSIHAIENALGVRCEAPIRELRRLFYCGEWIESHALHVFMLHAPDFLGYEDALEMARDHKDLVLKGLELKKIGNALVSLLGGREIHPISACVGGFYRVPSKSELASMAESLRRARDLAIEAVEAVRGLPFPDFDQDYEFVALSHPEEYPLNEGRLVSNKGLDIEAAEYEDCFVEQHVAHSNALHSALRGRGAYFVGPLARFNLNYDRLPSPVRTLAEAAGLVPPCNNPFKGIVVRALETVFACEEALRIVEEYKPPRAPRVTVPARAGRGAAATEAPRGILYHRYDIDANGLITAARIVPPTSQNQKQMEDDLRQLVPKLLDLPPEQMTWRCEQSVRNYDPCISCATHFLKLNVTRS